MTKVFEVFLERYWVTEVFCFCGCASTVFAQILGIFYQRFVLFKSCCFVGNFKA